MLVDQVASLFRKYTDESDTTFLTDADVALLKILTTMLTKRQQHTQV
jgi:hypothetical protein